MKSLFIVILGLIPQIIFSQINFSKIEVRKEFDETMHLRDLISFDIDNDGDEDMIAISQQWHTVVLFENDGYKNRYSSPKLIYRDTTFHEKIQSLYAIDIDKNGYLDIIVLIDGNLELLQKRGDHFEKQLLIDAKSNILQLLLADFDGDGKQDLLLGFANGKMLWYSLLDGKIVGDGSYVGAFGGKSNMVLGDLDGDGDSDVISTSRVGYYLYWYENNGNGIFKQKSYYKSSETQNNNYVVLNDVDLDGDLDIFLYTSQLGRVILLINNGLGVFTDSLLIDQFDANNEKFFEMDIADIDKDGFKDLVVASGNIDGLFWYRNKSGTGYSESQQIFQKNYIDPKVFFCKDIDHDGYKDIVFGYQLNDQIIQSIDLYGFSNIIWLQNKPENHQFIEHAVNLTKLGRMGIQGVDIDGDGDQDLLGISFGNIFWMENIDGKGFYNSEVSVSSHVRCVTSAKVGDMDGDGDMDIVSSSDIDGKIAWYENLDGEGTFGVQKVIQVNESAPYEIFIVDFDGDGDNDVFCQTASSSGTYFYENLDGQGTFGDEKFIGYSYFTTIVDIDKDGDEDIVNRLIHSINYQENDGKGNLTDHILLENPSLEGSMKFADIDNDGDLDFSIIGREGIIWVENKNGIYSNEHFISHDSLLFGGVFADLDCDDDLDILLCQEKKMIWYENLDGKGTFSSLSIIDSFGWGRFFSPNVADVNNDGNIDILQASALSINLYENLSSVSSKSVQTNDFSIYPNPVSDIFFVQSTNKIVKVDIFDLNGRLVLTCSKKSQVNISNLVPSIYFATITDEFGNILTRKIVKL